MALKRLPQDNPINKKTLCKYNEKQLICDPTIIAHKFGSIKNACKQANIRCDCLYGKEHMEYMARLNIKYNKENLIQLLKQGYKKYGKIAPTNLILKINKEKNIDIRGAIKKHFISLKQACIEANIEFKDTDWPKEKILEALRNIYNESGGTLTKADINNIFLKQKKICIAKSIRDKFGSLDKAAKEAGIKFVDITFRGKRNGRERDNSIEKKILDKIQYDFDIPILRQFIVKTEKTIRYLDGYIPQLNLAIEVDEPNHKQVNVQDFLREQEIKNVLNCDFQRIKLY